jgi:hypothetical protein
MTESEEIARRSVDTLAREVRAQREQFRFISRERYGGMSRVRQAIQEQLGLLGNELAEDLLSGDVAATSVLSRWARDDVRILTSMVVDHMISTAAALVDVPPGRPTMERQVVMAARKQLQLIVIGARHWLDPT